MSDALEVTYSTAFPDLAGRLATIKRPGDFYAFGAVETVLPALSVEGAGAISFPVPASQAREIIAAAERAPYGKGAETLVDESVRKVWQIASDKISLSGKGWEKTLEDIIAATATGLGCQDAKIEADLYKLLVYDEGGFFVAHRDSEKTGGMFGTLVISLPSAHEGGALIIRHDGRETSLDLCPREPGEVRYAAFYADCEHEVCPITSGHRVCLIYNLIQKKAKSTTLAAPDHRQAIAGAAKLLRRWPTGADAPDKLVYLLEHHYTQAGLSFAALKNGDAALATVLRAAAAEAGCDIHLGIVHIEESGSAEYNGDYYSRRRYRRDADDTGGNDEYEIGEVFDRDEYLSDWRDTSDQPVPLGSIPIEENELLPAGALDGEKPDKVHFSEATGNAGAGFERAYLRAALILWPRDRFSRVCLSGGLDAVLDQIGVLAYSLDGSSAEAKASALASLKQFIGFLPGVWHQNYQRGESVATLLGHLTRAGSGELVEQAFPQLLLPDYAIAHNRALLACLAALPSQQAAAWITRLFDRHAAQQPAACIDLWTRLAGQEHFAKADQASLAAALISHLTQASPPQPETGTFHFYHHSQEEGSYKAPDPDAALEKALSQAEKEGKRVTARFAAAFLDSLRKVQEQPLVADAVSVIVANTAAFAPDRVLLPALEQLGLGAESRWRDHPQFARLWEHCASQLIQRSETPPVPPKDWSQNVSIPEKCEDSRALAAFLRDPETIDHADQGRMARLLNLAQTAPALAVPELLDQLRKAVARQ